LHSRMQVKIYKFSRQANKKNPTANNLAVGRFTSCVRMNSMRQADQLGESGFADVLGELPAQHSKQGAGPDL